MEGLGRKPAAAPASDKAVKMVVPTLASRMAGSAMASKAGYRRAVLLKNFPYLFRGNDSDDCYFNAGCLEQIRTVRLRFETL